MIADWCEFTEYVERICISSWRTVFGRDCYNFNDVDSVIVTYRITESGNWAFSFAIRSRGIWFQNKVEIEPVEYDMFGDSENNRMPNRVASDIAIELVTGVAKKVGIKYE